MNDLKEIQKILLELKVSVEGMRAKIERLSGIEDRLRKMDNRITKVEQRVILLIGIGGTMLGAVVYKVVEIIFGG